MNLSNRTEMIGVTFITLSAFVFLSVAFLGQNVHVLGDEYTYSFDSQHNAFAASTYPVWIYLALFQAVSYAGSGFYDAARILNAAIFSLSIPFIYFTARRYTAPSWSLLISVLSAAGPINSYVAFFMPDAAYYTAFWAVTWFALTRSAWPPIRYGMGLGLLVGIATLVKPHGFFLFAAVIAVQISLPIIYRTQASLSRSLVVVLTASAVFAIVRFSLGYMFAGDAGLSLFGAYSQWTQNEWTEEKLSAALKLGRTLTQAHVVFLAAWLGPGLVGLAYMIGRGQPHHRHALALYALAFGGIMLTICLAFSVRIADVAPDIDKLRIHARYYNVAFPLFLIAAAAAIEEKERPPLWISASAGISIGTLALFGLSSFLPSMTLTHVDAPELRGLTAGGTFFLYLIAGISATCCLLAAFRLRIAFVVYLVLAMPIGMWVSTSGVYGDLKHRQNDLWPDSAAKGAIGYLGADVVRLAVASDAWQMLVVRYTINKPGIDIIVSPGQAIEAVRIPPEAAWLLVIGNYAAPPDWIVVADSPIGWKLYKRP